MRKYDIAPTGMPC